MKTKKAKKKKDEIRSLKEKVKTCATCSFYYLGFCDKLDIKVYKTQTSCYKYEGK